MTWFVNLLDKSTYAYIKSRRSSLTCGSVPINLLSMYPVFRRLDVLSAMQNYPAAGLCTRYHIALKKEAVRQVIIRQDDAFVVIPVKVLIQKLSQLVPQNRILHYGLEIFPAVKLQLWPALFRNG